MAKLLPLRRNRGGERSRAMGLSSCGCERIKGRPYLAVARNITTVMVTANLS
jgi:hypothetical protein